MGARAYLVAHLAPLLPKTWKLVSTDRNLDVINRITVVLKLQEISRTAAAPRGALTSSWVATIITPKTLPEAAERDLDEAIIDLLLALDGIPQIRWTTASRVLWNAEHQAFDITLESFNAKD